MDDPISVTLGDVNGDSKPDIVVTSYLDNTVNVLLNSIVGNFTGQVYTLTTGATTNLAITGLPAAATAGSSLPFTLTALDSSQHVVPGYTGTVHFSTTDPGAGSVVPADYTFVPADGGVHVFTSGAILVDSGVQTVTAFDTTINALSASASVSILSAAATHFAVIGPAVVLPNSAFDFTVTALDPFGNTVTGYAGTVSFASGDLQAMLPGNATLAGGVGIFSATLKTPGKQTVTAADSGNAGITGNTTTKVVNSSGVAPFVQSIDRTNPAGPVTNARVVTFTVTFSQVVVGVNLSDFALVLTGTATGTLTQVTPASGSVYTATVSSIKGIGTLGLNLVDNGSIFNVAGNHLNLQNAPAAFAAIAALTFATGANPNSVAIGDVNGDGKPDLVVANGQSDSVSVLLGNGDGTFQAQQTFATGNGPFSVAVGDVNGDGKPDLVVANATDNTVSVLLGNGNGTFQTQQTFATGYAPISVAVSDVNGDGKPDIVVANQDSNTVSVLLGNGTGTFQAQQTFAVGGFPSSVAVADVNGDGKPDIVVSNRYRNSVSVLLGNGDGTFQTQQTFDTGNRPFSVAVGDVNGDGKPDLVVANFDGNTVSVLLGNGNGSFQTQQTFASGIDPVAVALADVNGDGKTDLIAANEYSKTVSVLLGNGNGTFQTQQLFATAVDPIALAVSDVNGDDKLDLVVANAGSGTVSVLLGNGDGTFRAQRLFGTGQEPRSVEVGDVNGDGKPDVVVANGQGNNVSVLLGNGNGTFQTQRTFATGYDPISLALGDVNGDGIPDVVVANYGSNNVSVLLGNGNGTFQTQQIFGIGSFPVSLALGDINGDGKSDIVVANKSDNSVSLLLGNGNGTFQTQATFATGNSPDAVAIGDVNGDGLPDLIAANEYGSTVSVLLGNGNGTFQAQQLFDTAGDPIAVAVGDVNGDGKPDLVLPSKALPGTVSVLLGNGNGTFQTQQTIANGMVPIAVALGDVNGDGKPDLVMAYQGDNTVGVLLGNGNGTFQTQQTFDAGYDTTSVAIGDLNGDGKLDITVADAGGTVSVLLNSSNAGFTGQVYTVDVSAPATRFVISAPSSTTAANVFVFSVTAKDALGNTALGYSGVVHISSNDAQAAFSADATLTAGSGFFAAVLRTAGNQTLTASDTVNSSLTSTSAAISVTAAAANHFAVSAPNAAVTGNVVSFTVSAEDPFNNTASAYTGTVHFASSDASATLPGNTTLTGGVGVFSATLKSVGNQTLTATDATAATIAGTSNTIATRGLTVTSLTPTSTGFVAIFDKPFNPSLINLYDANGADGPDDVLLTSSSSPQISFHGSLIIDPSDQTITFVKTSDFDGPNFNPQTGVLAPGIYTVTLRSASNGFVDLLGKPLDGANNGNPAGSNYVAIFVVAATPVVVGIPAFARGPDSADIIDLPNNDAGGIPLNLSVGNGVTSGTFTLQFNSALLSITGASVNSSLTGASLSLDAASTAGNAILDFSSSTALTATGVVSLGGLVATVPNAAAALYKSKALLHWSGVQLNGGAITVVGDDAVQVVSYFGDTTGDGTLSSGDASLVSRIATRLDTNAATGTLGGFSAFQLADPVIVGNLSGNGNVDSADITLLNSFLAGLQRAQIPSIPAGLTITPTGPDPTLSVGGHVQATPAATVVVPVDIDTAKPAGSTGAVEAILALRFDPQVCSVSAADVQLGSLTSGWQLTALVNAQAGEIGIDLWSTSPIQTTAGGSLVTIAMHVLGTAPVGSTDLTLVNQVNPTGQRVFTTTVADNQGAFVLHQVVTGNGIEPGTPGIKTVASEQSIASTTQPQSSNLQSTRSVSEEPVLDQVLSQMAGAVFSSIAELGFGEMGLPANVGQETAFGQPAPVLNRGHDEKALTAAHGLALPVQTNGIIETDWTLDDYLAYLRQPLKHAASYRK